MILKICLQTIIIMFISHTSLDDLITTIITIQSYIIKVIFYQNFVEHTYFIVYKLVYVIYYFGIIYLNIFPNLISKKYQHYMIN